MADHLMGVARQAGIKYEVCEQVYMWADEQLKRKIIAEGLIGEVQHARLYYTNKADYHGINGARMLIPGRPVRVQGAHGSVKIPTFHHWAGYTMSEDTWDRAVIEFDSGVCLLFDSPPRARMNRRWDVEGSAGQLFGESLFIGGQGDFQEYPFITEYADVRGEKVLDHVRVDTDPPVVFENPYRQYRADSGDEVARMDLLIGMHRAITEDVEPIYGPQNAKLDLEILYAMRESARLGGGWVDLPLTAPTELERRTEQAFVEDYGHDWRDAEGLVDVPFPQGGVRYTVGNWD
jgi:predicted dehydrogenase